MYATIFSDIGIKLIQLSGKKKKNKNPIWAKDLHRHFPKEDIHIAHRFIEGCSASQIIKEMQIKTTMR